MRMMLLIMGDSHDFRIVNYLSIYSLEICNVVNCLFSKMSQQFHAQPFGISLVI